MTVHAGDVVEDFTLTDDQGQARSLTEFLADGPVVLFFYPAAMTKGCTAQACHFRDLGAEFAALGAQRVGISRDDVAAQRRFAEAHGFDYPLLSDPDGTVASKLDVRRALPLGPLRTKRTTIVIDTDRTVLGMIHNEVSMTAHADRALEILRSRAS
ncbi:peroxiredoxin [Stackebrandtia soli]|uniref:peroxiredoxin n=1 Tax=Stackebrandtia soli TaxID=1892856 RepID=UPI0039EB3FFA